jgi:hypothetical protein
MYGTTYQKGIQGPTAEITAGGKDRRDVRKRHRVEAIFWISREFCIGDGGWRTYSLTFDLY